MGWKDRLGDRIPTALGREIDIFETQIALRRQGKLEEVLFNETRLRRGVYGQRYDNGQRHDGIEARKLDYPSGALVKGPGTLWDAPGMQRIKIPFGGLSPEQMEALAEVAEDHADAICHVTTRQDFQLHFVHVEDTPTVMRRLAAAGITTREACGNSVRNVTACQFAGVCQDEAFDVTPYANALAAYLLGHDDCQDFGRKFKIAFSGCQDQPCGLVTIHDLGFVAKVRDGHRGFAFYVGGGLGSVPYTAQLFDEFLPEEELMPASLAVCRVFARLGEKRNRARARMKFLLKNLGLEEFKRLVREERAALRPDPRWQGYLDEVGRYSTPLDASARTYAGEQPLKPASSLVRRAGMKDTSFDDWRASSVRPQKQAGFGVATIMLPLGDITSEQLRALADLARKYTRGTVRTTVEQNLVMRWVSEADLPELHRALCALGLGAPGAGTIVDVTACPGTDTCKLGIASSRGLSAVLGERLAARQMQRDGAAAAAVRGLRIKVSGCFNSCGQHHIADIGFYGVSRKVGSYTVPHFQAMLGGQWSENAKSYGLAIGAIPSKNVPTAVDRLTETFARERLPDESFQTFIGRIGKKRSRELLEDLLVVPGHAEDPTFYTDWGDAREFTIGDLGVGECAGEVVSAVQFGLAAAERETFEAQTLLEENDLDAAAGRAYSAMVQAAKALAREREQDLADAPDAIAAAFRRHFYDTKLFFDPFAGGKFAAYYFHAHESARAGLDREATRQRIEEAQLFIEAAHACYGRMMEAAAAKA